MRVLALTLLTACGRLGFDDVLDAPSPIPDALLDGGPTFRTLCLLDKVTLVSNGIDADDRTATEMQRALADGCGTTPQVRTISQDAPDVLDDSGRLLLPADELVVIGGGDGPNRALRYMLTSGSTPLVWEGESSATIRERSTDRLIASGPITGAHDYAFLMVLVEPTTDTRVLSGQGLSAGGTIASALWFAKIAPQIAVNDNAWTLVEWSDTDDDAGASANDSFVEIESGR